ncbi:MAG: trehalose-phosphatase [Deltaproteobacteria bacterium]|nr:trehalose-phosphatase [Deltaproteobacteria bacterium]
MIPLFSKGSLVVLESLSFTKTLYAFDFDGTLAKIVSDPEAAAMAKTTEVLLSQLSKIAPVAIISGRSIEDLKKRISFNPKFLVGNHGLEGIESKNGSLEKAQKTCTAWTKLLYNEEFESGVEIEDKVYSIAIHYRKARNKTKARAQIKSIISYITPKPNIILGKCVVNILPADAPHKGAALQKLMQISEMKHAFYIGDDDTDEDIFSLPYHSGQIMSVRVGKKIKSQASYYIERQSEINRLIKTLIKFHQPRDDSSKLEELR